MITLKNIDTKGQPWILQTDNPMFGFVQCDKDGNYEDKKIRFYDRIITDQEQWKQNNWIYYHIDDFIINESGEKNTLYFYVVPKADWIWQSHTM